MVLSLTSPWPPMPGSYSLGSMSSPVALAIVGKATFELSPEHYCIRGHIRSANIGVEKLIANVVSNPRIRFLIVCGREEGHLPGDALVSLARNGVDEDMAILGTRAQMPYLPDLAPEAVTRFREQVEVIDLVHPKDSDGTIDWQDPPFAFDDVRQAELADAVERCERNDPGPYPGGPMTVDLPEPLRRPRDISMVINDQVNRLSGLMLRMPSERLSTSSGDVVISREFEVFADPVDGTVVQVPSLAFYARLKGYMTGQ